jgi:hypothetical protein
MDCDETCDHASIHPQHRTHIQVHCKRGKKRIVVLTGKPVPKKGDIDNAERHGLCILMLFEPWETVDDLRGDYDSWSEACQAFPCYHLHYQQHRVASSMFRGDCIGSGTERRITARCDTSESPACGAIGTWIRRHRRRTLHVRRRRRYRSKCHSRRRRLLPRFLSRLSERVCQTLGWLTTP